MLLNYFLYSIALVLFFYIVVNVARTRKFTVADAIAALGIIVSVIIAVSANPTHQVCPYTSDNDATTIVRIIQAEAEAVNKEDVSIIRNIFDPNAIIRFQGDGTEWDDPVAHYLENFDNADVINAVHFNIQPTEHGITSNTARFISGSSGTIIFTDGKRLDYYNELGKDTWVLKKNSSGCWVIVEFTFY